MGEVSTNETEIFGGGASGGAGAGASWAPPATFDPEARRIIGEPIEVTGNAPPRVSPGVWPWLIAAGVLGALWWITREDKRGPLAGAAG